MSTEHVAYIVERVYAGDLDPADLRRRHVTADEVEQATAILKLDASTPNRDPELRERLDRIRAAIAADRAAIEEARRRDHG